MIQLETFTAYKNTFAVGRRPINRDTMARAFISKSILGILSTVALIDRLKVDKVLRRLCGLVCKIPCEATFSNAFLDFAEHGLTAKIHDFLMSEMYADRLVGHISRDATAIESREKSLGQPLSPTPKWSGQLKEVARIKMKFVLQKSGANLKIS